jgi:hypothetical protein
VMFVEPMHGGIVQEVRLDPAEPYGSG